MCRTSERKRLSKFLLVFRTSKVFQILMEWGKHPVLNLRPGAIETLIYNGRASKVLLMNATSAQQIRTVMEMH
nr:hypothetical transcript [Hymenolepis microstoma]